MAHPPIIYMDSFMGYATADMPAKGWTSPGGCSIANTGGRGGRGALSIGQYGIGSQGNASRSFASSTVAIASVAFNAGTLAGSRPLLTLGGVTLSRNVNGTFSISTGGTVGGGFATGTWNHIALGVTPTNVSVWLNEALVYSLTGTFGAMTSMTLAGGGNSEGAFLFSDLVLMASNDTSNVDPLGDRAVTYSAPNGAGYYSGWTPSAGANYTDVDEANEDGDATYVSTSVVGTRDAYTIAGIPAVAASVAGVMPVIWARKTDAGTRAVAPSVRIGGVDYDQTATNLSTSYVPLPQAVLNVSPATGVAFTVAEVNGMQVGEVLTA
jgi:hypothetical protein